MLLESVFSFSVDLLSCQSERICLLSSQLLPEYVGGGILGMVGLCKRVST